MGAHWYIHRTPTSRREPYRQALGPKLATRLGTIRIGLVVFEVLDVVRSPVPNGPFLSPVSCMYLGTSYAPKAQRGVGFPAVPKGILSALLGLLRSITPYIIN